MFRVGIDSLYLIIYLSKAFHFFFLFRNLPIKSDLTNDMAEKQSKHTLTAKEIEIIHKMPTARLLRKLSDIGVSDEQLELMERDDLVRAWTSAVADGRDKPVLKTTGDQPRPIIMDPIIAEKQLEFERYKLDQEIKLRQQQIETERLRQQELQQLEKD